MADDTEDLTPLMDSGASYVAGKGAAGAFDPKTYLGPKKIDVPDWLSNAAGVPPAAVDALNDAPDPDVKGGDKSFQNIIKMIEERQGKFEKEGRDILEQEKRGTRSLVESMDEERRRMNAVPIPQAQKIPKPPSANEMAQGGMQWTTAMALLAGMGGAFVRRGSTAALTAFAAANQGFVKGRQQDFDNHVTEWKLTSQQVLQDNQDRLDQYNAIMKKSKGNVDLMLGEFKAAASAWGDEMAFNMANSKNVMGLGAMLQREMEHQETAKLRQEAENDRKTRLSEWLRKNKQTEDEAHDIAGQIVEGKLPPTPQWMGNYGGRNIVLGDLAKASKEGGFNPAWANLQWTVAQNAARNLNSARMQQLMGTADSVLHVMDRVDKLGQDMKNGNIPLVNDAKMLARLNFKSNSPQGILAQEYLTEFNALQTELTNLEAAGFAPHDATIRQVQDQLRRSSGAENLHANLQELRRVISYRMNAIPMIKQFGPYGPNMYTGSSGQMPPVFNAPEEGGGGEDLDAAMRRLGL